MPRGAGSFEKHLGPARKELIEVIKHKNTKVPTLSRQRTRDKGWGTR